VNAEKFGLGPEMSARARTAILLEDDAHSRAALEILLSDWGWTPVAAPDAAGALSRIAADAANVAAVITDYNLGAGVTGVDEVRALAAAGVSAPVLVLSGSMRGKAQVAADAAGHDYLTKPVNVTALRAWLARLL
jgi:DNA-binding response OmpR family regulator